MNKSRLQHPEWAIKFKTKGTELRYINNHYYLYKITSKWDKEKKKTRKITLGMIGKITKEEGLVLKGTKRATNNNKIKRPICCKEYGASDILQSIGKDIIGHLKVLFSDQWQAIYVLAIQRLLYQAPLKNMQFHYEESYLSQTFPEMNLSKNRLTSLMNNIGNDRNKIISFLKMFIEGSEHILFDITHVISQSAKMQVNQIGYNSQKVFDPQVNLFYMFSTDKKAPIYYRIVPGDISGIKALKLTVKEAALEKAIIIADKGFASEDNIQYLQHNSLSYILPLRRNSRFMDVSRLSSRRYEKAFDGHFFFMKRAIFYCAYEKEKQRCILFFDSKLCLEEKNDYLHRIEEKYEKYSIEGFKKKELTFGTILITTNLKNTPQEIYEKLKTRMEIESLFDVFKNTLNADRTYMQSSQSLEAWLLINHIALLLYYKIYTLLKNQNLLKSLSPKDLLMKLSRIVKLQINDEWITSEINSKTAALLSKLKLPVT